MTHGVHPILTLFERIHHRKLSSKSRFLQISLISSKSSNAATNSPNSSQIIHIFAPNAPSSETPQLQFRSLSLRRARSKGPAPWYCGLDHGIRGHEFFVDYMLYHMYAHIYICIYIYIYIWCQIDTGSLITSNLPPRLEPCPNAETPVLPNAKPRPAISPTHPQLATAVSAKRH